MSAIKSIGLGSGGKKDAISVEPVPIRITHMGVSEEPDVHPGRLQLFAGHWEIVPAKIGRETFEAAVGDADATHFLRQIESGKGGGHPSDRIFLRVTRTANPREKHQGNPLLAEIAGLFPLQQMMALSEHINKGRPERVVLLNVVMISRQYRDDALEVPENLRRLAHQPPGNARGVEKVAGDHKHTAFPRFREIDHGSQGLKTLIDELLLQVRRIPAPGELQSEMEIGGVENAGHAGTVEGSDGVVGSKRLSFPDKIRPGVGHSQDKACRRGHFLPATFCSILCTMPTPHDNIALLIDADNAPSAKIGFIMTELASHGVANIRRAYGNWTKRGLAGWTEVLQEYAIEPVQLFDMVKGKNGTDMRLVIDAMDMLYNKEIHTFCLVSSDCDFTPLCTRLRAEGKQVIGFGGQSTPAPFINSCTRFLYLDDDAKATEARKQQRTSANQLKGNTKLMETLRNAIKATADEDGWAQLGTVGNHISNQSSIDHRTFGFAKLSGLFGAIDLFEIRKQTEGDRILYEVREKKNGAPSPQSRP